LWVNLAFPDPNKNQNQKKKKKGANPLLTWPVTSAGTTDLNETQASQAHKVRE
jgi:hypothetical protein